MILQKNKILIFILLFFFCYNKISSQNYIGCDNFGGLTLEANNRFLFHYWDCGIDSGHYEKRGDTLILNSLISSVRVTSINCDNKDNIFFFNQLSVIEVYDSLGVFVKKINNEIDTINDFKVYIRNPEVQKGQLVNFQFLNQSRKVIWSSDTIKCCYIELDSRLGRKIYFENYCLLQRKNKLLPICKEHNEYFRKINSFEFPVMKLIKGKKKYKTHKSGFGIIN